MTTDPQARPTLTQHRLFPVVAATWCAAVLGLGAMAIGTTVLENIVLSTHLDRIVPAAAPPLGFTARLLVCLFMALAGGAGGFVLGLGLRRRPASRVNDAHEERPSVAVNRVDDDGEDLARLEAARENLPLRRRALTTDLTEENPGVLKVAELDVLAPEEPRPVVEPAPEQVAPPEAAEAPPPAPEVAVIAESPAERIAPRRFGRPAQPLVPNAEDLAVADLRSADLNTLGIAQLIERLALALAARRNDMRHVASDAPALPGATPVLVPAAIEPAIQPEHAAPAAEAAGPESATPARSGRPFDMPASMRGLAVGEVEWFEPTAEEVAREEAAMASLLPPRAPAASAAPAEPTVPEMEAPLPPAPPTPRRTPGPYVSSGPVMPGDVELWNLPEPTGDDEPDERQQEEFSSLLDMKHAARPAEADGFVRVEDEPAADIPEPVVVFPGQPAPAAARPTRLTGGDFGTAQVPTEAALREALAALQRMSGNG